LEDFHPLGVFRIREGMGQQEKGGKMKKHLVIGLVCAVLMLGAMPVYAADVNRTVGLGYQGVVMSSYLQGVSVRSWVQDNIGVEGTIAYTYGKVEVEDNSKQEGDIFDFSVKAMYAPIVREHHKFYVGLEAGYGMANVDYNNNGVPGTADTSFWTIGPLFGVEYFFQELPELGFCWEAGYKFNTGSVDDDDNATTDPDVLLHGLSIGLGVHYYF